MDNPINSQDKFKKAVDLIGNLDKLTDIYYNVLSRTTNETDIVELQAYIDRIKRVRLGWFMLTQLYTFENNSNNNGDTVYSCVRGDTLALISQAFYNNIEYGEYLYYYNELETPLLEAGQKIKIPQINSEKPPVLFKNSISFIEQDRVDRGLY